MFFFNDSAPTAIYTLSLHDALPISKGEPALLRRSGRAEPQALLLRPLGRGIDLQAALRALGDRKSTRLNSSHANISYAVFCLKKKKPECWPACLSISSLSATVHYRC